MGRRLAFAAFLPYTPAMPLILVMAGGAIGAGARFLVGRAVGATAFPYATLAVNVLGGLLMGVLAGLVARGDAPWRLFLGTGVLGGFTTFSTFALDAVTLAERGAPMSALLYAGLSVAGSVLALVAGLGLARGLA
jgi:fluoride exporter